MEAVINAQRKREAKNPLADKITNEQFFRNFYLPYLVINVFFDHVDTVLLLAAQMRIEPLKKVCRQIKAYRADYEYLQKRCMDWKSRQVEMEHTEFFIDIFGKELSTEYNLVKWQVSKQRKMLNEEWRLFIASVYMAMLIYEGLREFCKDVDKFIDGLKGGVNHSIIPDMIPATYNLLKVCLGDCDILEDNDLKASRKRIVNMIESVRFEDKNEEETTMMEIVKERPIEQRPGLLYKRYLEEKGDMLKTPKGTTRKLMKEFGFATRNEFYVELRKAKEQYENESVN